MTTNEIVIFVLIVLMVATVVSLAVWWRAYRRNQYIENSGRNPDGSLYNTPND